MNLVYKIKLFLIRIETFEFLPKPSKSSFLRKQESSPFKVLWIPAFAGMTKEGRFSKVSYYQEALAHPPRRRHWTACRKNDDHVRPSWIDK